METVVEVDPVVFESVLAGAARPGWVRLLCLVQRMRAESDYVLSSMTQAIVWDPDNALVKYESLGLGGRRSYDISKYFKHQFDFPDWTEVLVLCDVDGTRRATVGSDPNGPPETSYVTVDEPFWDYVGEHRAELEELGRRHYGTAKRGFLRQG